MFDNPYDVLGIEADATPEEIRKAYRARAATLHPDQGGGVEAFQDLGAAYAVLKDPVKRAAFDRTGQVGIDPEAESYNDEMQAMSVIASIIEQALTSVPMDNLVLQDMVADIVATVDKRIANICESIDDQDEEMADLRGLAKRFKRRKKGGNLIRSMLEAKAATLARQRAALDQQLGYHRRALVLMEGYEFQRDQPPGPQQYSPGFLHLLAAGRITTT